MKVECKQEDSGPGCTPHATWEPLELLAMGAQSRAPGGPLGHGRHCDLTLTNLLQKTS